MTEYIIISILWFLAGVLQAEQETIIKKYAKTWISGDWWNNNNWKYDNPFWQFMFRYPLSFMKDGEHFTKSLALILLAISVSIILFVVWWQVVLCVIALYVIAGIGFNVSFHDVV